MKKLLLLLLLFIPFVSCVDKDRFKDLGVEVNTALPIGKYGISSEDVFSEMMGMNVTVSSADGVLELTYANDDFNALGPDEISGWLEIDNQQAEADFDLSSITGSLPAGTHPITIDDSNKDVFTSTSSLDFKNDTRPVNLVLKGGTVRVDATTDMPTSALFVRIPQITRDGQPLDIDFGVTELLDGCVLTPEYNNGDAHIEVMVMGSSEITSTSSLSADVFMDDVQLQLFEGDLGRQVSVGTSTIGVDIASIFDNVETFYPGDIMVNLGVNNTFESLPMLLVLKKLTFVSNSDPSKNVEVALKNGLGSDRFFLGKGETNAVISNAGTVSGKGISDAVSRYVSNIFVEFEIITNPTDADAMGQVTHDDNNIIDTDTEITSSMDIKIPMKGYMKGLNVDESMKLDLNVEELDAKTVQYNLSAVNSFPMNVGVSLMLVDRGTGGILYEDPSPISINGSSELKFSNDNIRTISSADAIGKLLSGNADIRIKMTGETVGADNHEIVSFTKDDKIDIQLFLGVNGVYIINSSEE